MNNKMCIIVVGLLTLLVGCEPFGRAPCGPREVTVNYNAKDIVPHPEHVRNICRGDTLTVKFEPRVERGSGHTAPDPGKNPEATWLSGSDPDKIELVVGAEATVDKTYKYSITIDGVGTVDPRVTVKK